MLKLSACIEMLYTKLDFAERAAKVAALGYPAFEFWGFDDKKLEAAEKAVKETNLPVAACGVNVMYEAGASMLNPAGKEPLVKAVQESIKVAPRLKCKTFLVTTGKELPGVPREEQHKCCVEALRAAAPVAEQGGITLVLEPLNVLVNHKGYFLPTSAEAFQILDEVGSKSVKLLFDIYHQQITEGDVTRHICENIDKIGHFHVADNPGRHEPGTGEMNYAFILKKIAETNYQGYVGLEFTASDPEKTDQILKDVLKLA
jgi:hydroxypyruvate isomerase